MVLQLLSRGLGLSRGYGYGWTLYVLLASWWIFVGFAVGFVILSLLSGRWVYVGIMEDIWEGVLLFCWGKAQAFVEWVVLRVYCILVVVVCAFLMILVVVTNPGGGYGGFRICFIYGRVLVGFRGLAVRQGGRGSV